MSEQTLTDVTLSRAARLLEDNLSLMETMLQVGEARANAVRDSGRIVAPEAAQHFADTRRYLFSTTPAPSKALAALALAAIEPCYFEVCWSLIAVLRQASREVTEAEIAAVIEHEDQLAPTT